MATSVPYPFPGVPQYQGNVGQSQFMHGAAAPQMQGPAPSSTGYGSRFTPNWQSGLPANGPGPMAGAAPRPISGPMSPMQAQFAAGPRTGAWPPAPGGAAVFSSNRAPVPAPMAPAAPAAPAAGGMMRGLLGTAGRALMSPLGAVATTAATMMPWGEIANGMRNAQQGVNDFLGMGPDAPAPMPTPQMAMDAAPPPMTQSFAPYPDTAAMRYPAPIQAPVGNDRPTMVNDPRLATPAPMPMAPAPQMQAPAPQMQAPAPQGAVWQGQNQGIGDDTRARAMAWLALQQGMR